MNLLRTGLAGVAIAGALSFGALRPLQAHAQDTVVVHEYDSPDWQAPRGYAEVYHESGSPNMVAQQSYIPRASTRGRPTCRAARSSSRRRATLTARPPSPRAWTSDQFKQQFREAFVKGYTNGYK